MKLPAYPRYKPSGVDWVGDVPEHWVVKALTRVIISLRNGTSAAQVDDAENTVPVTRIESISGGRIDFDKVGQVEWTPAIEGFRLKKGDILLSHINSLSMVGNCAILDSDQRLYSGMNLLRIQPEPTVHAQWLWRAISSDGVRKEISSRAKPAINQASVTTTQIKSLQLPVPPLPEQVNIADFLDRETARLDTLTGKKRELIGKLKEKRTALISRTVTRGLPAEAAKQAGLNPHSKPKASGIEWLGDIPEHWDVMRLKWRARCHSGDGISPDEVSPTQTNDAPVPVVGGNGVMGYCETSNCDDPVIVIGRVGALCGNVHCIKPPAWVTDNALLMPINTQVFRLEYLAAVLRSRDLNELADKTAQPLITGTRVRSETIPIPPIDEQNAIAAYLDHETAKIDKMIEKVEAAIDKLQEYRTALITAAVTGKIDVRAVDR